VAEGHSVVRWARWLAPLLHEPLVSIEATQRWAGRIADIFEGPKLFARAVLHSVSLSRIRTHGKHLLLDVSNGEGEPRQIIHCHGMMYGTWQVGKVGMALRKPESRVRLRLRTARHEAVFFNGPVVEFLSPDELKTHQRIRSLGPDILHANLDREEIWRRLQLKKHFRRSIGDASLDQTILAGVGNIFKSEGLFLARLDPRRDVAGITRPEWERFLDATRPLMQAAAKSVGAIRTLPANFRRGRKGRDALNFVYFRSGRPCYLCSGRIARILQGQLQRSTYFCPQCQR
jgi:formamidopyrimidine-DNA glycosylase